MRHLLEHGADALGLSPTQLGALSAAFKGEEDVDMDARDEPTPETQRHSFDFVEDDFR